MALATPEQSSYRMMVNIHMQPKDRTRYVGLLEKISSTPYVTYMKLIVSMLLATAVVLGAFVTLVTSPALQLKYTAIWTMLGALGMLALVVMYALPARHMSLLTALTKLTFTQRVCEEAARHRPVIPCLGVDKVRNDSTGHAVLHFSDGCLGRCMRVSGCIGLSTLPSVAESVAQARFNYLLARKHTTQEQLITTVTRAMFTTQLSDLRSLYDKAVHGDYGDPDSLENKWRAFTAKQLYARVYDTMRGDDAVIEQYLILRETDGRGLMKAMTVLEQAVAEGLYSNCRLLTADEFKSLMRLITASHVTRADRDELPETITDQEHGG